MEKSDIAEILGSNRIIALDTQKLDGPLTYLNLIKEVNSRISTKRGRPTDVRDTKYHNIPLTEDIWNKLKQKAKLIPGKKILSASHLAAFLIEEGLNRLEQEIEKYNLKME